MLKGPETLNSLSLYSSQERQKKCVEWSTEQLREWKRGETSYKGGTGGNFTGICAECRIYRGECVGMQGSGGPGVGPEGTGVSQVCVSVSNGTINSPSSSIMRPRNHERSNISLHKVITGPLLALINLHIHWVLLCALPLLFLPFLCERKKCFISTSPSVSTGHASTALTTDRCFDNTTNNTVYLCGTFKYLKGSSRTQSCEQQAKLSSANINW